MTSRRLLIAGLAAALPGCTAAGVFNTLAPRDAGGRRVATSMPYGTGPRRTLDVYAPSAAGSGRPLLVFVYGGSWDTGDKSIYPFVGTSLAAAGFVTVIPDYRLVPEVRFPGFVEDGAAAVRWAVDNAARYGASADRLVLMGHSAGAYTALMLTLDRQWLTGAGVPPERVRATVGLAGPYDFYPFDVAASRNAFGGWRDPAQTQPISFARGDAPPVLLATGEDDRTVQPRNSYTLAERLRALGATAEVRTYPGVDHVGLVLALSRLFRGRAPVLRDSVQFFRRYV